MEMLKQPLAMTELENRDRLRKSTRALNAIQRPPHQGKRETERRRKQLAKAQK